ncbi:MAG: class I SAM-dependent methyltransferase [Acidimicrobiales bacterium]
MADHPIFAAVYDRLSQAMDAAGMETRRRRLLSEASGRVLDVGAGTGLNLPHYREVEGVVALEPDGAMRRRLLDRLGQATVPIEVHEAGIDDAPLEDQSFDTVVCTLVLCTVPNLPAALERIGSLLRPGGQLLFIEHVKGVGARAAIQRVATPVWRHLAAGCHLDRDTPKALRDAGFAVTDLERFQTSRLDPFTGSMVQGRAQLKAAA